MTTQTHNTIFVYVGTYTRREPHVEGKSKGIYVYRFDPASGALTFVSEAAGVDNPSYLALDPRQNYLYAVNEVGDFAGQSSGAVSAFAIAPKTGELTYLNQQASGGAGPCYVSVDKTSSYVLAANYGGGSVAMFPIKDDGRLGPAADFVQHEGSSVNPRRQEGPHAHSITIDPANRYAFAADLGLDKMLIYRLDLSQGKLIPNDTPWVKVEAGAGPRHFAFHPSSAYAYLINEIGSTVTAFTYDETQGTLEEIQTISTLPADFTGTSHTADIHVAPSGKFLYGSNRGHDSIVIFAIDEETGKLTLVGHESTQGKVPRNFALDPSGTFLLAANQNSDTIVTYQIDRQTGQLTPTGHVTQVPTPVCIKFTGTGS